MACSRARGKAGRLGATVLGGANTVRKVLGVPPKRLPALTGWRDVVAAALMGLGASGLEFRIFKDKVNKSLVIEAFREEELGSPVGS